MEKDCLVITPMGYISGIGYAVRSEREKKSVQIYPEKALEYVP
jgi:hypothetical protein